MATLSDLVGFSRWSSFVQFFLPIWILTHGQKLNHLHLFQEETDMLHTLMGNAVPSACPGSGRLTGRLQ